MSDHHNDTHGATTIHAKRGGGAGKWLLGGLAALVLVGGGYAAWKTMGSGQNSQPAAQTADNNSYSEPSATQSESSAPAPAATPVEPASNSAADQSSPRSASTPASATTRHTARAHGAPVRTAAVPQETIGVTPTAVTAQADEGVTVTAPRRIWTQMPTASRLASFYPDRARESGREGEASLRCTVLNDGALDCVRVSETPGSGFGNAALRVAHSLRHAPTFADGSEAAGAPLNLRVVFKLADAPRRGQRT